MTRERRRRLRSPPSASRLRRFRPSRFGPLGIAWPTACGENRGQEESIRARSKIPVPVAIALWIVGLLGAVVLAVLAVLWIGLEEPPSAYAAVSSDQRLRDVGPLQIKPCSTWPAKSFNKLLKRRAEFGGKSPKKWASRPVCVRPHVRRVQAQVNRLLRICTARGDPGCRWLRTWNRLSKNDRKWAIAISSCEVRAVWPDLDRAAKFNNGNGFYGAFQFVLSTWHSAGGSGYPTDASWHEQAVRSVRWRNKAGTTQWPACSIARGYA